MRIKHRDTRHCRRRGGPIGSSILTVLLLAAKVSGFALPPSAITSNAQRKSSSYNTQHHPLGSILQSSQSYFTTRIHHHMNSNDSDFRNKDYVHKQRPLGEQKKSVVGKTHHQSSNAQTVFASILLGLALIFSGPLVPPANAGFGPSGGATTSQPTNLITPRVTDRSDKKLKQLIGGTFNENRLEEFSNAFSIQVDDLTEALKNLLTVDADDGGAVAEGEERKPNVRDTAAIEKRESELEQVKILQKQIADQGAILVKLGKQPYWFNYLAAFIGSVASTLVMHPLDTIKTRLQLKSSSEEEEDDEGFGSVMSLYEGLAGNILKEGPPSALYLGVYETVKCSLLPLFGPQSVLLVYLASGASGEMIGSIIRAPAEAIKTNVQSGMAGNALEASAQVFGTAATRANVVRAWSASLWRDVPFGAIQLAIFELTKTYILNNPDIDFDSNTLLTEAIIGAFAGGWGALLTNPTDIITTRIITQSIDEEGDSEPLGVIEMGKELYGEGGLAAFLVGWQARVGYWAPAISIFLTCYCSFRQMGVQREWF